MAGQTAVLENAYDATPDSYAGARTRLAEFLIGATLIESYHSFARNGKRYHFLPRSALIPGASTAITEQPFQRTALVFLVDQAMPTSLRKHIRFRSANEITRKNLRRLAPDLKIPWASFHDTAVESPGFTDLLDHLLELDFGLMLQRDDQGGPIQLTHMHVKVERLTDNALRNLAADLGYIRRTLYERGEAYVERFERKYYEYFGFAPNASGRKSAAAMAAQLLYGQDLRFTVFASCQEDCRLTVLDDSDVIEQYFLVSIDGTALEGRARTVEDYMIDEGLDDEGKPSVVVCLCVRYKRTHAARPTRAHKRQDDDLYAPWLELIDEVILPLPGRTAPAIPYAWSESD